MMEESSGKNLFYKIFADGIRSKLLESVVILELIELIGPQGSLTLEEITSQLQLSPLRAKKWLRILKLEGYVLEKKSEDTNTYSYSFGPLMTGLYTSYNDTWFNKSFVDSWRTVCYEDVVKMLQGGEEFYDVNWPPSTIGDTLHLEEWMSRTAMSVINLLDKNLPLSHSKKILDIGGGDGTIACALAQRHPSLNYTIYNLPEPIKLATYKIQDQNLVGRVHTIEGNFLTDNAFPKGYDIILFSRVLCDWPEEICRKLLTMAYEALDDRGQLVICEPFRELNEDLILIWEFRYMFWDAFGRATFRTTQTYKNILKEIGFSECRLSDVDSEDVYRVLKAIKQNSLSK